MTTSKYLPEPRLGRWAYAGCEGMSTDDLMRPDHYSPERGMVRMPSVLGRKAGPLQVTDGIGTESPTSRRAFASKAAYALRCELGLRAYAELTGTSAVRTRAPRESKAVRPTTNALADRLDGEAARAERLRAFTAELQSAGTIVLGQMN